MTEIFIPEPEDQRRPVDYVANPLCVQLSPEAAREYGRPFTRMDLIALANNIIARETDTRELRTAVAGLAAQVNSLEMRLRTYESGKVSSKVARALEAFANAMRDDDEPSDYPDSEY
jgi:hypothetical protein